MKDWFTVNVKGFRALYANRSKIFIINELCQNAWDEHITLCDVLIQHNKEHQEITIQVVDDSPEGFKDITHAYTLFADTYKRQDPTKRGRFNLGEKQVIAVCDYAQVRTTKGTIIFDNVGRHEIPDKTDKGSWIEVHFEGTEKEAQELIEHAKTLLVPANIKYIVNEEVIKSSPIVKSFDVKLHTDILVDKVIRTQMRETKVNLIESSDQSWIYEMGIPIMKTDCPWHIDVQQKVHLNIDRDNILPSYVQDLYAEVLNNVYEEVEEPSSLWVRTAMKDTRITKEAVKGIMTQRFGDKFCIANPLDPKAMGEAISRGFRPIFGGQMSAEEWSIIKDKIDIESATQMFGDKDLVLAEVIEPNKNQKITALYAKKIAKRILGINIDVKFVSANGIDTVADYDRTNKILRFNVAHLYLKNGFFDKPTDEKPTKLIIHELSHEDGGHIDYSYQEMQSTIGAKLTMITRKEPNFHEV